MTEVGHIGGPKGADCGGLSSAATLPAVVLIDTVPMPRPLAIEYELGSTVKPRPALGQNTIRSRSKRIRRMV